MRVVAAMFWTALTLGACGGGSVGDPVLDAGGAADGGDDDDDDDAAGADAAIADAAASDAPPVDARACTGGDAQVVDPLEGTCYIYVLDPVPWAEAVTACEELGAHLAVPTDLSEVVLLTSIVIDPDAEPDTWLGATDVADEDSFVWVTGEPFIFDNWRDGEPNNGGGSGTPENCAILEADNGGTWDDRPCSIEYPYLCEFAGG